MAKKTEAAAAAEETKSTVKPTTEQRKLAIKAVCAILGCGSVDGATRVDEMDGAKVVAIADFEKDGKRREAVALLYS